MIPQAASLGKRLVSNASAAIFDLLLTKISTTLVFVLLVRLLDVEDIAAVGIATGYLVIISFAEISPIRVLLRDYPKLTSVQQQRDRMLTAMFIFWVGQSLTMLLLGGGLCFAVLRHLDYEYLQLLFIALTMDFIALSFDGWIKMIFYVDLRQGLATRIGIGVSILRLSSFGVLLVWPSLHSYAVVLIVMGLLNCLIWLLAFVVCFRYRPLLDRQAFRALGHSLWDYGLWNYLNRMSMDTLFQGSTAILAWMAAARDVADYAIALRFTSLLFILPGQLSQALYLGLAHATDEQKRYDMMNTGLKATALTSMAQLAFVVVFGNLLMTALFGSKMNDHVRLYALLITLGVSIMSLGFPMLSAVNNFTSLQRAWTRVFVPMLFVGLGVYVIAGLMGGALGMAVANIIVYTMLTMAIASFLARNWPFPLRLRLLSVSERRLLRELLGRRG